MILQLSADNWQTAVNKKSGDKENRRQYARRVSLSPLFWQRL